MPNSKGTSLDLEQKFEQLYDAHVEHIAAYLLRRAKPTDAADIVAETFSIAWRRIDDVPEEPATRPWLYGVARNTLANNRRSHRRSSALQNKLRQHFDTRCPSQPAAVEIGPLRRALAALSDVDREVLFLSGLEKLSSKEIGQILDISPEAVRGRLHRARSRVSDQLQKEGFYG